MKTDTIVINQGRNVTLTAYIQDVLGEFRYITKRPGILILPGGGYQFCSDREADPVAMPYLMAGYQVFVLRYSVGDNAKWPNPLEDYESAMGLIRKNSDIWHVYEDKVAVLGFSAGGHLAGAAAVLSKNRPNAAILGYAVLSDDVKFCSQTAPDVISHVDGNTCPCFIFATRNDSVVPIMNSVKMIEALTLADVTYESHIYAYGPHGFSTANHSVQETDTLICDRVPGWVSDSIGWLRDILGDFSKNCLSEPRCKAHVSGDLEDYLSINCTLRRIMSNSNAKPIVQSILGEIQSILPKQNIGESGMPQLTIELDRISGMILKDVLNFGNVQREVVDQLDEQLGKIPNI